jgi:phage I-like protein
MREVMLSQALRDPEWFKGYVEAAPVLAIFGEKGSAGEPKRDVQLSDADRELAAKLGVSEERYLASKQAIEQQRALVRG